MRPVPANPTSLLDLVIDDNLHKLGGKSFLIYDSGPGPDIIFGTEENKNILLFSSIWMSEGNSRQFLLFLDNSTLSMDWLEVFVRSEMVTCFLASMSCCQVRVRLCIRGCGRL